MEWKEQGSSQQKKKKVSMLSAQIEIEQEKHEFCFDSRERLKSGVVGVSMMMISTNFHMNVSWT